MVEAHSVPELLHPADLRRAEIPCAFKDSCGATGIPTVT
jgi:hypothetical protein